MKVGRNMTSVVKLEARSRTRALTRDELRRQLLALVLAAVLAWYAFVIPAGAPAKGRAAREPDEGARGEIRGAGSSDARAPLPHATETRATESVEDLEWPEYIYVID